MARYIIIDNASGYVWADSAADRLAASSPIEFAREFDKSMGEHGRIYEEVARPDFSNEGGYHVYEAAESFPTVEDGQDQAMIERVEAECSKIAYIRLLSAE